MSCTELAVCNILSMFRTSSVQFSHGAVNEPSMLHVCDTEQHMLVVW